MHGDAPIKKKLRDVIAVDLFCGAGGTSTGLLEAAEEEGYSISLTAINHWQVAIATHSRNHDRVIHYNQSIELLDPASVVPGRRLQLLVASPECTHHSRARGGKPRSDQKRADAWLLMRWVEDLYIENLVIENVKEFQEWGPLTAKGLPDKRYKGTYFKRFIEALRVNYSVEYKVLNCADYGDPTTRERLFIIAKRGKKRIVWPKRTHASRKELGKMTPEQKQDLRAWVPARDIIDWSIESKSIFGRKTPLKPNTLRRIFKGFEKYSLKPMSAMTPFIVPQFTSPDTRDIDRPLGSITTTSRGIGVCEPVLLGQQSGATARPVSEPAPTVAGKGAISLIETEAFQVNLKGTTRRDRSIDEPTFSQATGNHQAVVECESFLMSAGGPQLEAKTTDEPMRTVLTRDHQALVEVAPFTFNMAHTKNNDATMCKGVDETLQTIAGKGMFGLVEAEPIQPILVNMKGQSVARSIDEPTFTQTMKTHQYLAEAYIVKFYSSGDSVASLDDPLDTITGKDRFGLCIPSLGAVFDIRFRMLQPHELAAATSFPKGYEFTGTREEKVKQIGNAVPVKTARALCRAVLAV